MNVEDCIPGRFYWVIIVNDPDAEEWERHKMPALYCGDGKWRYINVEGVADWPVCWVGPEIVLPPSYGLTAT